MLDASLNSRMESQKYSTGEREHILEDFIFTIVPVKILMAIVNCHL